MKINSILIIDDEKMMRMTTTILLQNQGYKVHSAADGQSGLALMQTLQPDVVLLDIVMPGLSGWDVLQQSRERSSERSSQRTPLFVIFSADDYNETILKAQTFGIQHMLAKPFQLSQLLAIITDLEQTHA